MYLFSVSFTNLYIWKNTKTFPTNLPEAAQLLLRVSASYLAGAIFTPYQSANAHLWTKVRWATDFYCAKTF